MKLPPCIPDSHLYRVTNTRCRIVTVFSADDGYIVARNIQRKVINILRKFVHQVGSIYKMNIFLRSAAVYLSPFQSSCTFVTGCMELNYTTVEKLQLYISYNKFC